MSATRINHESQNVTTIEQLGRCEIEQLKVGPKGEGVGTSESMDTETTEDVKCIFVKLLLSYFR